MGVMGDKSMKFYMERQKTATNIPLLELYFHYRTHFCSVVLLSFVASGLKACCPTLMVEYKLAVQGKVVTRKLSEYVKK